MTNKGITTPYGPLAEAIGKFRNNWRQRDVYIFAKPNDPNMVVTVEYPFDGGAPFISHEPRALFTRYIGTFDKVCE
jgi:hypothetical protein